MKYGLTAAAAALLGATSGCGASGGSPGSGSSGEPNPMPEPTMTAPEPTAGLTPPASTAPPQPSATATTEPDPTGSPPAPTYDPSVTFDWPEAQPSTGTCQGGTYLGTFQCDLAFIPGFPPSPFTGPLTFVLTPSQDGEFLVIDNARFDAETNGIPFGADLVGEVECATGVFTASLENGIWGDPATLLTGTFFGTLSGNLDPLTNTLSGTWELTSGTPAAPQTAPCIGTWTTLLQP